MIDKLLVTLGLTGLISLVCCEDSNTSDVKKHRVTSGLKIEKKITLKKPYKHVTKKDATISITDSSHIHPFEISGKIPPLSKETDKRIISKLQVTGLDFDIDVLPEVAILDNIPDTYRENPPLRKFNNRVSMKTEMISLKDLDYGKYKAVVFQNPMNKQDIKGFIHIPTIWAAPKIYNSKSIAV